MNPATATRILIGAVFLLTSACGHEALEQRVDAVILDAAKSGTGCPKADAYISRSEDVGPNGFIPKDSADKYAFAGFEYSLCAKASRVQPGSSVLHTYAAIADDMAAVRYVMAKDETFAYGAYVAAKAELATAKSGVVTLSGNQKDAFNMATSLIAQPPKDQ